ncbi:ggdef:cbs:eal domain protein [Neisseria bacilliformis ATCC BAA-1200]|uniref:Ggdef:cbs:eal domain protein n=1 Tax=Neisseria bacilliformis ATCC BAA-1200 TaxID=888742 RepID=F2B9S9_9NEIS|nr:ggdef:cbs:eal domain protein [Neisseria bacilliformis ATCC BAA-1200]
MSGYFFVQRCLIINQTRARMVCRRFYPVSIIQRCLIPFNRIVQNQRYYGKESANFV